WGASIVNSTPYGIGNWFHGQWVNAVSGGNDFAPIRLYWQMHPERDIRWYNQMKEALGPRRTAQEVDGDFLTSGHTTFSLKVSSIPLISAKSNTVCPEVDGDFLTSGHTVFDLADIKGIEDTLSENVPIEIRMNGALRIFEKPRKKSAYFI